MIIFAVTVRTLALKKIAETVSPEKTAFIIGIGTFLTCLFIFPLATIVKIASLSDFLTVQGNLAGLGKGILLGCLLIAQQNLIGKSLSATTYVFPLATGGIALSEMLVFGTHLSLGGILSITVLFLAGILFITVGYLGGMSKKDKVLFLLMVLCVIGFAMMDKTGIPLSGWYSYLLITGLGNMLVIWVGRGAGESVPLKTWIYISVVWVIPELFFNYTLATYLPVTYGYLAITLRIPVLMLISVLIYKEGRLSSQMLFSIVALIAVLILMVDKI